MAPDAQQSNDRRVRLGLVGDLIFGRGVSDRLAAGMPAAEVWGDTVDLAHATDAMVGNLEGPITARSERWPGWKAYTFRAHRRTAEALAAGNFRAVALANNHILDYRDGGLLDTRAALREAGIAFAGAGADEAEAWAPAVFDAGGVTVGFASITDRMRTFAAAPGRAGTACLSIRAEPQAIARLAAVADGLKQRGAALNILSVHWGPNQRWWPTTRHRAFARAAIAAGFQIVHGHSAHVLQAFEFHGGGIILYDTGNFVNDFRYPIGLGSDRSFVFVVEATAGEVRSLRMVPVSLTTARVSRATGARADAIRRAMVRRCRGYPVAIEEADGDLIGRPLADGRREAVHAPPPTIASPSSTANSRNR